MRLLLRLVPHKSSATQTAWRGSPWRQASGRQQTTSRRHHNSRRAHGGIPASALCRNRAALWASCWASRVEVRASNISCSHNNKHNNNHYHTHHHWRSERWRQEANEDRGARGACTYTSIYTLHCIYWLRKAIVCTAFYLFCYTIWESMVDKRDKLVSGT